jgi:hypothetical protein
MTDLLDDLRHVADEPRLSASALRELIGDAADALVLRESRIKILETALEWALDRLGDARTGVELAEIEARRAMLGKGPETVAGESYRAI